MLKVAPLLLLLLGESCEGGSLSQCSVYYLLYTFKHLFSAIIQFMVNTGTCLTLTEPLVGGATESHFMSFPQQPVWPSVTEI